MQYEYSLVIFTVFGQLAAGIALLVLLTGLHKNPEKERQAWLMTLVAGVIAFGGSTLHLTQFGGAPYIITRIASSWIALEVAVFGVFGVLVLLRLFKKISASLNALVAFAGMCFVGVMSQVYKVDIVPLWNTCGTEISFFGTALLLGGAFVAPLLLPKGKEIPLCACATSASVFFGVIASASLFLFWVQGIIPLAALGIPLFDSFVNASLCMGLSMLVLHLIGSLPVIMKLKSEKLLYLGAFLILGGSLIGRMLFYAANIKLGVL